MRFPFEHGGVSEKVPLQKLIPRLQDADRGVRQAAAAGITRGLQDSSRLLTYLFNTLVLDHRTDCTLRRHASVMSPRNLANEIPDGVVDAVMSATERYHGTVQRYYRLKGRLLGLEPLYDYDRYAPLSGDLPRVEWQEARRIVEAS